MSRQRHFPQYLSIVLGEFCVDDYEWKESQNPVGKRERAKLKNRARKQGKRIADDWLADARKRADEFASIIAADEMDQCKRDEREAEAAERVADLVDSVHIAGLMLEAAMPADQVRRQHRAMKRAIQREREKLAAEAKKLAKAKLLRLGKR